MKKKLFLCLFLLISFSAFAQKNEKAQLPPDQLKLRTDLENDQTILKMSCGLYTEINMNHPSAKESLKFQKQAIKIRRKFYATSRKTNQTMKVKTFCRTDEGAIIVYYLIVDKGKVKYIGDYSRDPFGGLSVNSYDCDEFLIGYFVPNGKGTGLDFTAFKGKIVDKKIPVLQCRSGYRELNF